MGLESKFQQEFIATLRERFPSCVIIKHDPNYIQGLPDLIVLYGERWAALEIKRSLDAPRRPNQEYYIKTLNRMSYASFVYPENKEQVLDELQQAFTDSIWGSRFLEPKQVSLGELRRRKAS